MRRATRVGGLFALGIVLHSPTISTQQAQPQPVPLDRMHRRISREGSAALGKHPRPSAPTALRARSRAANQAADPLAAIADKRPAHGLRSCASCRPQARMPSRAQSSDRWFSELRARFHKNNRKSCGGRGEIAEARVRFPRSLHSSARARSRSLWGSPDQSIEQDDVSLGLCDGCEEELAIRGP
jgi:hypothetical protein